MARGRKKKSDILSNQVTLFDFCPNKDHFIAQGSSLICAKQKLRSTSKKLITAAIMQIRPQDEDLKPYVIKIKEFATLVGTSPSNLYRDIESITDDIIKNPVYIRTRNNSGKEGFIKIPWVEFCEYVPDLGIILQLSNRLKPYLIGLKNRYEQYQECYTQIQGCCGIYDFDSFYSTRIFELLADSGVPAIPKEPKTVIVSVKRLRECCGCEDSLERFSNFREKVLDMSTKEINRKTIWNISYTCEKDGKKVDRIKFMVR